MTRKSRGKQLRGIMQAVMPMEEEEEEEEEEKEKKEKEKEEEEEEGLMNFRFCAPCIEI
jgi:hypothetical protein